MTSMTEVLAGQLADHIATARAAETLLPQVIQVGELLCRTFGSEGRLYTFGNGGSAADAQHLAAEFIGRYKRERRPLPAVALAGDPSVVTCIGNDYRFDDLFARQVTALARPGDVVAGFTTSGRSPNVVAGLAAARDAGATTRWRIEENLQAGKGCAALDEHQLRTWTSWHRWVTLSMLAHAFLAVTVAHARTRTIMHGSGQSPDAGKNLVPLTCNEIRHLRATLTRPAHDIVHITRWSRFRRHHQHRRKLCHYRRRQQRDHELLL